MINNLIFSIHLYPHILSLGYSELVFKVKVVIREFKNFALFFLAYITIAHFEVNTLDFYDLDFE